MLFKSGRVGRLADLLVDGRANLLIHSVTDLQKLKIKKRWPREENLKQKLKVRVAFDSYLCPYMPAPSKY